MNKELEISSVVDGDEISCVGNEYGFLILLVIQVCLVKQVLIGGF
jgi:hypothetical protein